MQTKYVSKVQMNGRICLGPEIMKVLQVEVGDYVQLFINPKGPQVKIQKVMPYKIC